MDLTAITLTELRYVVAVAEHGHFGRAADACHVSQPTLSTQVKKLEENLGVRLFERAAKRITTTAAGQDVLEHARAVLAGVRAIGEVARGHREPLVGPLRLGVIPTLGPYLIPWLVPHTQQAFPRLRLTVREAMTAQLLADLGRGEIDAALLALPVGNGGFVCEALFDEPFWILAPISHPLASRAKVSEDQLDGHHVLLLADGHCLREQALSICRRKVSPAADDFRATSLETLRQLVAVGAGCTLLPALAVPALATLPTVVARPFRAPVPGRRIGLVWRRGYPHASALHSLAAFVRTHVPDGVRTVRAGESAVAIVPATSRAARRR